MINLHEDATTNAILNRERERLVIRPGETWEQYRDRFHAKDRGVCRCPMSRSLCKAAYYFRAQTGNFESHGGYGWSAAASYGWGPEA